ncbi:MAG: hypothetical protein ACRCY4_06910 [Brevinema sp.]
MDTKIQAKVAHIILLKINGFITSLKKTNLTPSHKLKNNSAGRMSQILKQ